MKKLIILMISLTVIAATVPAEAGLGIKLKGGYTNISYGDYNGWVDQINEVLPIELVPGVPIPRYEQIHWIPEISAELTYPLFPSFSGSAGIGYLSGKADYEFSIEEDALSEEHKVRAIPIFINIYWEPSLQSIQPFVYGGIGFYGTKVEFSSSLTVGGNTDGYNAELDKWGIGLQGGAGISFSFATKVSFDLGIQGRWADISGFEGTATRSNGDQKEVSLGKGWKDVEGTDVYYYGPATSDDGLEEASVNLSGYTIFIGMTIGL